MNIHRLAVKRLFELVARQVDETTPSGPTWHRDLLGRMAHDVAGVRPAVISASSAQKLDRLRRFRHLVRNVYAMNLIPERMAALVQDLHDLWPTLEQELRAFARFLEQAARQQEEDR